MVIAKNGITGLGANAGLAGAAQTDGDPVETEGAEDSAAELDAAPVKEAAEAAAAATAEATADAPPANGSEFVRIQSSLPRGWNRLGSDASLFADAHSLTQRRFETLETLAAQGGQTNDPAQALLNYLGSQRSSVSVQGGVIDVILRSGAVRLPHGGIRVNVDPEAVTKAVYEKMTEWPALLGSPIREFPAFSGLTLAAKARYQRIGAFELANLNAKLKAENISATIVPKLPFGAGLPEERQREISSALSAYLQKNGDKAWKKFLERYCRENGINLEDLLVRVLPMMELGEADFKLVAPLIGEDDILPLAKAWVAAGRRDTANAFLETKKVSRDAYMLHVVISAFAEVGDDRAFENLKGLMKKGNDFVKVAAAREYAKRDEDAAFKVFGGVARRLLSGRQSLSEGDGQLLGSLCTNVSEIGGERAKQFLDDLLAQDKILFSSFQWYVAPAITQMGGQLALGILNRIMAGLGEDSVHRGIVAESLGELGMALEASPILVNLAHDSEQVVRLKAFRGLGLIGGDGAVAELKEAFEVENRKLEILSGALEVMSRKGASTDSDIEREVSGLIGMYTAIVLALGQTRDASALEILAAEKDSPLAWKRKVVAEALGVNGSEAAKEMLLSMKDDEDSGVRDSALLALFGLGDPSLLPLFIDLYKGYRMKTPAFIQAVIGIKGSDAPQALYESLSYRRLSRDETFAILDQIGLFGPDAALPLLTEALDGRYTYRVRYAAARVLLSRFYSAAVDTRIRPMMGTVHADEESSRAQNGVKSLLKIKAEQQRAVTEGPFLLRTIFDAVGN